MQTQDADLAPSIGRVLKELRKRRDLSLNELSEASGVSASMLSQIENGRSTPTVAVLWKIAKTLDVPLPRFLEEFESASQVTLVRRREAHSRISRNGQCAWRHLGPVHSAQRVGFFEITLKANASDEVPATPERGWSHLHLTAGQLIVGLAGRRYGLAPGDTLRFRSDMTHTLLNPGNDDALAFLVTSRSVNDA